MFATIFWLVLFLVALFGLRRVYTMLAARPAVFEEELSLARENYGDNSTQAYNARRHRENAQFIADVGRYGYWAIQTFVLIGLLWQVVGTSLFYVGEYNTAHVVKQFTGGELPAGAIIAVDGENGPQSKIYGPGWHWETGIGLYANVDTSLPAVEIPPGHFGEVVALDGRPLPQDAVIASPLPGTSIAPNAPESTSENNSKAVFDAYKFLNEGYGYKGLQSTVLKPGLHRLNLYLFNVRVTSESGTTWLYTKDGKRKLSREGTIQEGYAPTTVTTIETGHVGVVKSNMIELWRTAEECSFRKQQAELGQLTAVLVPDGCKGVWTTTFEPGAYYFNPAVYEITQITTRAQRWTYKGGYDKCVIDLTINENGSFKQDRKCETVAYDPDRYADRSIFVKVEGWDIPVELRVLVQVRPENAPAVVAAVGSVDRIEDRIITPSIRSVIRNIGGGSYEAPLYQVDGSLIRDADGNAVVGVRPTRALDFQDHRDYLERAFESVIIVEAEKAGITMLEVKMGEPGIPPELLVSRRREQLADQLRLAFQQEDQAQKERIKTENSKATADQQDSIVQAEVNLKNSENNRQARANEGRGEREYLEEVAAGQKAQSLVLGQDRVMILNALNVVMGAIERKPELVKALPNPNTLILGGGSLDSASAILSRAFKAGQAPAER